MQNFDRIMEQALEFRVGLDQIKAENTDGFDWYPYDTMANFWHLQPLITPEIDEIFSGGKRFADIGAADGALAYYLESRGNSADVYDYGPTNYNNLQGVRRLKTLLQSGVNIHEMDLDSQFAIEADYDFIFFLGILYHVKNPFYILEQLSKRTRYMAISTRVVKHFTKRSPDVSSYAAAYLVGPTEANNDATNYWMFTLAGLRQIIDRSGWDVVSIRTVGDTKHSNPQDANRDERAFAILRSRR